MEVPATTGARSERDLVGRYVGSQRKAMTPSRGLPLC